MNTTMNAKRAAKAKTHTEIGFDVDHDRVGWRLTTFIAGDSTAAGDFVEAVENVPLPIAEALERFPQLRGWILSETGQHVKMLADMYPGDVERLRAELGGVTEQL